MHVLFIHQAFPAQFGRLALELTDRYGWRCEFLIESLSSCPTPSRDMLRRLTLHRLPASRKPADRVPWPQTFNHYLELCQTVRDWLAARPDIRPDLVVAHGGRGAPTLFLRDVVACPVVTYCEYWFAPDRRDLSYRVDLPPAEPAPFYPRCLNAATLGALVDADAGYAPTRWQKASFPKRFHGKIAVHFDGVDTEAHCPAPVSADRAAQLLGREPAEGTKIVTFAARGLESVRGFDLFLRVAKRVLRERSDVLFVVVGGEQTYYGWDALQVGPSFKEYALRAEGVDPSRLVFLGQVDPTAFIDLMRLSDLHVYLSVPFVTSWSLFDALACGRTVLAGDTEPVREIVTHGENGLLAPLMDADALADTALRVLADPAEFTPLGRMARERVEERYSLDACVPALRNFFTRAATRQFPPRAGRA